MKKLIVFFMVLCLLPLAGCGANGQPAGSGSSAPAEGTELHVFAAASLTETLDQIIALYAGETPDVTVIPTYDSSGTLLTQIREGADCDLFLSAAPLQMDALEDAGLLLEGTRRDLLENRVVLSVREAVPELLPDDALKLPESFDALAQLLRSGEITAAIGNSDVPVGQYTRKIFAYYGLDEAAAAAAGRLTYGSNVKEVVTQISEGAVDCGIVYATDAFSAGLTVADEATAEMCGRAVYPAAVLNLSSHPDEAKAFLNFLSSDAARTVFESVGFTAAK